MDSTRFSQRVVKALAAANAEAARLQHEYVGTEHILLGLALDKEGVATVVLENLGVNLDDLRERIESTVMRGRVTTRRLHERPYTSRARIALELATASSRGLGNSYVGVEHLLLGILEENGGIAAFVLAAEGVTAERVREETVRLLGRELPR